ncbi:hypothetical protein [Nocardia sp. NPDC051463]|uniref:hypothetical protein n=1 Tax=Nocardia sp. NPDC051463 TaxID=3154845 RepID=UPI00344D44FF
MHTREASVVHGAMTGAGRGGINAGTPGMSGPPGHNGSAEAGAMTASPADTTPMKIIDRAAHSSKRLLLMAFLTSLPMPVTLSTACQGDGAISSAQARNQLEVLKIIVNRIPDHCGFSIHIHRIN